jgi:hypothetical protein
LRIMRAFMACQRCSRFSSSFWACLATRIDMSTHSDSATVPTYNTQTDIHRTHTQHTHGRTRTHIYVTQHTQT